jgi:4-hydroxy-L-threonine phosphate dehydrogenase PdxA
MISPEIKQKMQRGLLLLLVLVTLRAGYILYQRHQEALKLEHQKKAQEVGYANPDYYVSPKKLYPYDIKSAKQLTQQPVWVKEGYRYTYYPYDRATKKIDFKHEAGLLMPIEKLAIQDVVKAKPAGPGQQMQVMATFEKQGKSYAVPIGYEADEVYKIYSDEMFFIQDPHELYKHWSADVWESVEQHQVKPGMNEMQADFAIGMGVPDSGDTSYQKTVRYPNGGNPLVVVYHDGKAVAIRPGSPAS